VQPNREIGRQSLRLLASAIAQDAQVPASASLTLETFLRSGESIAEAGTGLSGLRLRSA
jgi:hypothetical protein